MTLEFKNDIPGRRGVLMQRLEAFLKVGKRYAKVTTDETDGYSSVKTAYTALYACARTFFPRDVQVTLRNGEIWLINLKIPDIQEEN